MAPAVPKKGNQLASSPAQERHPIANHPLPPEVAQAMKKLAEAQAKALEQSRWVGEDFAETSRAMHYGERETETIHGQATADEVEELLDEGISVAPLPFPVAGPEDVN